MKVNPNKYDVRVIQKFKDRLELTDKDIEKELHHLKAEDENTYTWVTGQTLEDETDSNTDNRA